MSTPVLGLDNQAKASGQPRESGQGRESAQGRTSGESRRPPAAATAGNTLAALRVAGVVGAVIAIVGWTDLAFAWFPLEWGNPEWEFGTSSRTFDGLPLATIGVGAIAASAVGLGSRRGMLLTLALVLVSLLLVFGAALMYWLTVPPAWAAAPDSILASLKIAALRTSIFMILYLAAYSWLAFFLWRRWRGLPSGGTS